VACILGDRAVKAARQSDLPKSMRQITHDAPQYAEGTGVRLKVKARISPSSANVP
jgi:hypothetical protein